MLAAVGFGDSLPNQQRTEYPNTNLAGVQFSYAVLPTATEQQCQDAAKNGGNIDKSTSERINGVNYLHVSTDSAGMCHQVAEEIYAASHAGRCYLFDALIETICADTIEGARNITPAEINTVKLQLQHIMQSVKLDAKK